jgi:hypothetical protein
MGTTMSNSTPVEDPISEITPKIASLKIMSDSTTPPNSTTLPNDKTPNANSNDKYIVPESQLIDLIWIVATRYMIDSRGPDIQFNYQLIELLQSVRYNRTYQKMIKAIQNSEHKNTFIIILQKYKVYEDAKLIDIVRSDIEKTICVE